MEIVGSDRATLPRIVTHKSSSQRATEQIAEKFADSLSPVATICLNGQLGAGKSVFARALIRSRLNQPDMAVPSPSYTLANIYTGADGSEIWHADLYRISDPEEIFEIGLADAVGAALVIVEWAERWTDRPKDCIEVTLAIEDDTSRRIEISQPELTECR